MLGPAKGDAYRLAYFTTPAPATLAKGTSLTSRSRLAALMTEAGIRGTKRVSPTASKTAVEVAAT